MATGVYKVTDEFEREIVKYTGAPYAITVDNASNALFLCMMYEKVKGKEITIPNRTYPSVPCEIIHAGAKVNFEKVKGTTIKGSYQLKPTKIWDAALHFSADMYLPGTHMCCSFTGPYKTLKLSKGGCILTDCEEAALWFKRARYSGRRACSYHDDNFDMIGWNFYMMPELATRGLLLMSQFYSDKGRKLKNKPVEMGYPDLSEFKIYTEANR
jgi:dTDP-4-amino-4,6-dideoxygalactose transaminase